MAKMFVEEENLISVADHIRAKGGTEAKLSFPNGFNDAIDAIPSGGGENDRTQENKLLARTIVEYENNEVEELGNSAFRDCKLLEKVVLKNVKVLKGSVCFYNCKNLYDVQMPNLEEAKNGTNNGGNFYGCSKLESVSFPKLKNVENTMFYYCTGLKNVELPLVTTMSIMAFIGCSSLEEITLPSFTGNINNAFNSCSSLKKADVGNANTIYASSFINSALNTLILRRTSAVVTLSATSAFTGTPIASGTGYIYVPKVLIEEYKVATNWVTYADQFRAIEDYPDIVGSEVA